MLFSYLSIAIGISGSLAVWMAYQKPQSGFYLCKPLTTFLILLIPILGEGFSISRGLITAGLGFSLAGDIFLMLPEDRFLAGWGAFLLAHLCYIIAFSAGLRELFWEPALVLIGFAILAQVLLYQYLGKMKIPVLLYIAVISVMAWMAWSRWLGSDWIGDLLAAWGAFLFMVSDLILAVDRFRSSFPAARTLNLLLYYGAQWLIAASVVILR